MAGRVLSAAVGSLLVLVALLLKCQCTCSGTISANAAQVIPSSYEIHSAAVYEDPACEPPSSSMRVTPNSPVTCFPRQATGATPRLTDGVLGPDNLTSTTTDYAYTLAGPSQFGLFKTWITFDFTSRVSVASVTLHYYCTGESPQIQLDDGSGVVALPVSPQCDSTVQRQCLTINVSTSTSEVNLKVLRNSNTIYISEAKFFAESSTPTTDSSTNVMDMPTATPSSNQHGPLSTDDITSTLPNSSQTTTMATPKTSPSGLPSNNSSAVAATTILNSNQPGPLSTDSITSTPVPNSSQTTPMATPETTSNNNETSSAVAGAVAGVVAGLVVCIAVAVLLIIACFIFKWRRNILKVNGQRELKETIDNPVYHMTAEGNASPEYSEETYTTLHNPLYETGKGPDDEPKDNLYTTVDSPHYDAVKKDSRVSPSTGQSTHPISPAASANVYSVPFSPDTDTYTVPANATNLKPVAPNRSNSLDRSTNFATRNGEIDIAPSDPDHTYSAVGQKATEPGRLSPGTSGNDGTFSQAVPVRSVSYTRKGSKKVPPKDIGKEGPTNAQTQKRRQAGDRAAMEHERGGSESNTTAGAVYAVVDKKRKEQERAMAASKIKEFELEKSAATSGAVYAVLDKTKKAPPPLPPPYQPGD